MILTLSLLSPAAMAEAGEQPTSNDDSLINGAALATSGDSADVQINDEQAFSIQVVVEGLDKTIISNQPLTIQQGTTALEAVKTVLEAAGVQYEITESQYGPYVKTIDGLTAGSLNGWDGWGYTVNGESPWVGLSDYILAKDDQLTVYYSKYPVLTANSQQTDSGLLATIELIGDVFTEKNSVTALENWQVETNTNLQLASVKRVSNQKLQLTFDGQVQTAGEAAYLTIHALAATLSSGEAQEIVLNETAAKINFRVEGYKGTYIHVKDFIVTGLGTITAAQATKQVLDAHNLDYKYSASSDYFSGVAGEQEKELGTGSGWTYKVNGSYPDQYSSGVTITDGDTIVWDYINSASLVENLDMWGIKMYSGTESVDKVTFNPIIEMPETVQVGDDISIQITGKYNRVSYLYEHLEGPITVALADVTVEFNDKSYVTDADGRVTIPGQDVVPGTFDLRFTKDLPGVIFKDPAVFGSPNPDEKVIDSYPRIIRTYKTIEVQGQAPEQKVIELIQAIPSIEEASETNKLALQQARAAYEALTAEAQAAVTNLAVLVEKEKQYEALLANDANRQLVAQAITKAKAYVTNSPAAITLRVNESHSGYWLLSAMYGLGMDVANYNWTTSPTAANTYWTKQEQALTDGNVELGTIIGAKVLGLNPTAIKSLNVVEKLLARETAAGTYTTAYGEPWAMVALGLTEPASYSAQAHVNIPKALQNTTTGLIGTEELTGWWLIALAPYKEQPAVKAVIDKAVAGLHASIEKNGFVDNANTLAAMIHGLGAVGENIFTDKWAFEQGNLVSYFVENYQLEDGAFKYKKADTASSPLATEQAFLAIADAYAQSSTFVRLKANPVTASPAPGGTVTTPGGTTGGGTTGGTTQPTTPNQTIQAKMSIMISSSERVLAAEQFDVYEGETVFDLLQRVAEQKNIAFTYRTTSLGAYVEGIAGVSEFDRGPLSGWTYKVNGSLPDVSADSYTIKAGDVIQWVYTGAVNNSTGASGSGGGTGTSTTPTTTTPGTQTTQNNDTTIITTNEKEGTLATEVTQEAIKQHIADQKAIVIQGNEGAKVELPVQVLSTLQLTEQDKVTLVVEKQANTKQVKVQLAVEAADGTQKAIQTGKNYVKVTLPGASANTVVLQLVDGELKAVPHKVVDGEIVLFVKASGTFVVSEDKVTFTDIEKLANKDDIEFLANRLVIKGKEDGVFAPSEKVTRAQFAAMVSRALGLQAAEVSSFTDTKGKWYESDVQALFEAGITTGKTANTFDPGANMTREQGAAFMARILAYTGYEAPPVKPVTFKDDASINKAYKENVALLVELGILSGKEDGTFDAKGNLTRGQLAKMLKRTLTISGLM